MSVETVWVGDSTCYGYYAGSDSARYSTLTCTRMGWHETNVSVPGTGFVASNPVFSAQVTQAASRVKDAASVDYVFIMGGVNDGNGVIAPDQVTVGVVDAITAARKAFPRARVVVGVGPSAMLADATKQEMRTRIFKAIRAAASGADLVIADMERICGTDPALIVDHWHPNARGHALIADRILDALDLGGGADLMVAYRRYAPGNDDPAAVMVRDQRRREREKREANRPTGTETDQTSRKLKKITAELKAQQQQLEAQQKSLEQQQEDILRTTPVFSTYQGSSPGGVLGGGWSQLVSLHVRRDATHGKRNAILLISVSAVKTGDGMPLLKCLAGGASAGVFPGVTANGDDFGGTSSTSIGGDVDVVLYGRSTVDGASPVGSVSMKVTVISLA